MLHYTTGGDRKLFGDASYQLGLAFINNDDPQTALMVRNFNIHCCTLTVRPTYVSCHLLLPLSMLDILLLLLNVEFVLNSSVIGHLNLSVAAALAKLSEDLSRLQRQ